MIVHLVLFRPKGDLAEADRAALAAAVERARREIRSIRSFRIGQRRRTDAEYTKSGEDFPYAAIVELDDEAALDAYLRHPAHADLARFFWTKGERAVAYDFET